MNWVDTPKTTVMNMDLTVTTVEADYVGTMSGPTTVLVHGIAADGATISIPFLYPAGSAITVGSVMHLQVTVDHDVQ